MNRRFATLLFLVAGTIPLTARLGCAQGTAPAAKTAEQAFKNIKILKAVPADQLIPSMQFISASLGVECSYCHVEHAFEKDDKKPKEIARKMMEMMFAINKERFGDQRQVTCYSCHRGSPHPVAIPVIAEESNSETHPESAKVVGGNDSQAPKVEAKAVGSDSAAIAILEKWVAALGGADAIRKVTARVENGAVDLGGKKLPIEIYAQAPDKRLSAMHTPNGDSITAFNGTAGWLSSPGRPTQWMSAGEADVSRLDAELSLPIRMTDIFSELHLLPAEMIDGHEVGVVEGARAGKPPVNFYFDHQSGLLVRMVRYVETPLGLNPTQIDYADYRDAGGTKIPYRWTIARPSGRFTIQVEKAEQNIPIPSDKFAPPAP